MTNSLALRSRWQDQFVELSANSNFHNSVREILATDPWFRRFKCYQEVSVADICEGYGNRAHRFDWYIPDLGVVVELHGEQHYKPTAFGSQSYNMTQKRFEEGKQRDIRKKEAAEAAGLTYIEISYRDKKKLTAQWLKEQIL